MVIKTRDCDIKIVKREDDKSFDVYYNEEWVSHILSKPDNIFDSVIMIHEDYRSLNDWKKIIDGIESYFFKNKEVDTKCK